MVINKIKGLFFYLRSRKKRPDLIPYYFLLVLKEILRINFHDNKERADRLAIDILIPTASKDFSLLTDVILSLKNINQTINKIFIVSPKSDEIRKFCENNHCVFIDESDVLPYGKNDINYKVNGLDRSGWILQQILKLSGDKIVEQENYFVLDADTLLVNRINLVEDGKFVFFQNREWNQPYFVTFKKIFGYPAVNKLSFTSHMMIFNKTMLKEMKDEIEKKHSKSWDKVYLSMVDPNEASCISDYDNYANWVLINHPDLVRQKPLYNKGLSRSKLLPFKDLEKEYYHYYKTISFHSYIK